MANKLVLRAFFSISLLLGAGVNVMAGNVEEPAHTVTDRIGRVEIREYQPVVQAVTTLESSGRTSAGFRRLAGYIFGGNEGEEKIAMTAPVTETLGVARPQLAFTMPRAYDSLESLPQPSDPVVTLVEVPARTVAVIGFSGWATSARVNKFERQLRATLASHGIVDAGPALLNQYNPPWTPPFMPQVPPCEL